MCHLVNGAFQLDIKEEGAVFEYFWSDKNIMFLAPTIYPVWPATPKCWHRRTITSITCGHVLLYVFLSASSFQLWFRALIRSRGEYPQYSFQPISVYAVSLIFWISLF